jgi:hypothetical protein
MKREFSLVENKWIETDTWHPLSLVRGPFLPGKKLSDSVDPWYMWVYGSKETTIEEKLQMLWVHRLQCCTVDA